jgi:hypothetical protein
MVGFTFEVGIGMGKIPEPETFALQFVFGDHAGLRSARQCFLQNATVFAQGIIDCPDQWRSIAVDPVIVRIAARGVAKFFIRTPANYPVARQANPSYSFRCHRTSH